MPFLYIYSPSDFVGGLPDESGAQAAGTPPFTLTLVAGAQPTLVEVNDNDIIFDEIDGSQSIADAINLDGTAYGAGTTVHTAYDLINTSSGHRVTSLHFGGNGYQQGPVDGLVSTVPLQAGQSYTFNRERTSHQKNNQYEDYFACFAADTLVDTPMGPKCVGDLKVGDQVMTRDEGAQPVEMILRRDISAAELASNAKFAPVKISAGALAPGIPDGDLWVSPQHRMLIRSTIAERMFGATEALVAAHRLTDLPGINRDSQLRGITYVHLVLPAHHIIRAEGAWSETFLPGPMGLAALPEDTQAEMAMLFPDLRDVAATAARFIPTGKRQARLIARHLANAKPVQPRVAIA
ncbi:MAG: Hint domain-containing protein [Pseudomonadota bacterium]